MKEIRTIGLFPFHQSIIQFRIQRFLLLQAKTPSDLLFNLSLRPFNFPILFYDDQKDEKKIIGNARSHVTSPLQCCLLTG